MKLLIVTQKHVDILNEGRDGKWIRVPIEIRKTRDNYEKRRQIAEVAEKMAPYNELCRAALLRPVMGSTDEGTGVTESIYEVTELGAEAAAQLAPGAVIPMDSLQRRQSSPAPCPACGQAAEIKTTVADGETSNEVGCPRNCRRIGLRPWRLREKHVGDPRALDRLVFAWNVLTQQTKPEHDHG